jgi:4-coumarate--CoA ligase
MYERCSICASDALTEVQNLVDIFQANTTASEPFDLSQQDNRKVPACMCFSSGTSGKPKGVVLSHYSLIAYCLSLRATSPTTYHSGIREVWFPPLAHIYGIISTMLIPSFVGSYAVLMRTFEFSQYINRSVDIRASILRLVPSTAIRIVKDPEVRKLDLSCVNIVYCSGASLSSEVVVELQKLLQGTSIIGGYGMSEGTITTLRETWSERKAGSVGKPASGVSIRVVDNNYNDVGPGEPGECLFKGPTQFTEYRNNRQETESTFQDGWLCTGDIVKVDEDGFFWITGRKKELIKYKGELIPWSLRVVAKSEQGNQVPPAEIEAVLLSHPQVVDAGVCGVYDAQQETELPVGYVSLGSEITVHDGEKLLRDINEFVKERVSPYKQLRGGLYRLEDIPKGNTGKLLRRELPAKREEIRKSKL